MFFFLFVMDSGIQGGVELTSFMTLTSWDPWAGQGDSYPGSGYRGMRLESDSLILLVNVKHCGASLSEVHRM